MTKEILITVTAPINCTEDQFMEWIEYCTGASSSINVRNPLHEYDMGAENVEIN
jgi:hypothetical protein